MVLLTQKQITKYSFLYFPFSLPSLFVTISVVIEFVIFISNVVSSDEFLVTTGTVAFGIDDPDPFVVEKYEKISIEIVVGIIDY